MRNFKQLITVVVMSIAMLTGSSVLAKDVIISKKELPVKAQTFIDTHFKGKEVLLVEKDTDILSVSYTVRFRDNIEVEFDNSGEWDEVDGNMGSLPTSFILKPIVAYITENFKETGITKIEKENRKYEVKLSNGLELEFSKEGIFKRIDN